MAVWILTQMKRWGYIKGDADYTKIAEQVFLADQCRGTMKQQGHTVLEPTYTKHTIMGKVFDPTEPEEYLKGFAISRTYVST